MSLNLELSRLKENNMKKLPPDTAEVILKDIEIRAKSGITKNALKTGDKMPEFQLSNAVGSKVYSDELLHHGPMIVSFYRGAWCPYCNLELAAYQEALPDILDVGAQLVAISPELPDTSISLVEKHALKYEVLSDLNNDVARDFGLVYRVEDKILRLYEKMGIDLAKAQGNESFELPFAATYIIDSDGTIIEEFVNYDFTQRMDPYDAIEIIKTRAY